MQALKPAADWSEKDVAQAAYDLRNLTSPQLTGFPLQAFRTLCENFSTKELLYEFYIRRNHVLQLVECTVVPEGPKSTGVPDAPARPEAGVVGVSDAWSPGARVRAALAALGGADDAIAAARRSAADPSTRPTILEYHAAYLSGSISPVDVAETIASFFKNEDGSSFWLNEYDPEHMRAQAAASAKRYAAGAPLSVLDGVPFAVKDAIDVFGHTSGSGTTFLGAMRGAISDVSLEAPAVAALRSLGAVCIGKTQMQEFGLLPTGLSAKLGFCKNPHNLGCIPGGSSGGSACVVAAGVVPFAIGTDGGGSVRIPAALCGVVGLKPTQGRMASDPDNSSLVTLGPITTTVADSMLVYAAMACPGSCFRSPLGPRTSGTVGGARPGTLGARTAAEAQAETEAAAAAVVAAAAAPLPEGCLGENASARPPLVLPQRLLPTPLLPGGDGGHGMAAARGAAIQPGALQAARPLAGIRIGVFREWFADADPCIVAACDASLAVATSLGAELVDIKLPELDHIRVAHLVTFLCECYATNRRILKDPALHAQLHEDTRIIFAVASKFASAHYLQAQRVRRRQAAHWRRAFQRCDFIATPGTATAAPPIPNGAHLCGVIDLSQCGRLVRFTQQANLLGLPALVLPLRHHDAPATATAPRRHNSNHSGCAHCPEVALPASLQLIGQPWHDAAMVRVGAVLEEALRDAGLRAPAPPIRMPNPLVPKP